nr:hypothetical protein [Tanacetum cinerariifolium]
RTTADGEPAGVAAAAALVGTPRWCLAAAAALAVPAAMVAAVIIGGGGGYGGGGGGWCYWFRRWCVYGDVAVRMAAGVVVLAVGDRRSSKVAGKVAVVDWIDRVTGNIFGFTEKSRRKTFSAAAAGGGWPEVVVACRRRPTAAGGEGERISSVCVLFKL